MGKVVNVLVRFAFAVALGSILLVVASVPVAGAKKQKCFSAGMQPYPGVCECGHIMGSCVCVFEGECQ